MLKFNKHHVTNGTTKARVWYSLDNRTDGRACVTMYEKDYKGNLGTVLGCATTNDSDIQTDYFAKDRAVLFADHPMYAEARARVESFKAGK